MNVLSIRSSNDTVLAGAVYPDGSHSVTSIPLTPTELTAAGPVPIILSRHPILIAPFGTVVFDNRNQDRVAAFEASDWLFHWSTDAAVDSVMMPKVRRRGARTDLLMATAEDTSRGREALFKSSMPTYVRFVSDRKALVIHGDLEFSRSLFAGTFFASVVDVGGKSVVCSDLLIPVPTDPLPRFFSRSDTLFAIVQHSEGRTFVLRLRIPLDPCHL